MSNSFAVLRNNQEENTNNIQYTQDELNSSMYLTLGQKLKGAREAKELSVRDVAEKLRLKPEIIESFDNDNFVLPDLPLVFTKGYVKNYLHLVGLSEDLVREGHYGDKGTQTVLKPNLKVATPKKTSKGGLKLLTSLILLSAVGMTGLWWWQDYQKENESREILVNTSEVETDDLSADVAEVDPNNVVAPNTTMKTIEPEANTAATAESVNNTQDLTASNTAEGTDTAVTSDQENANSTEEQTASDILNGNEEATDENATTEDAATTGSDLRIEMSAPSWVTVRGDDGKTLATKLYKAGETLNFSDNETYRLTVGAPVNVKVYYKGQEIPMKLDGSVARFKLPK